jgi:addiction module RelE/StbE family toxin
MKIVLHKGFKKQYNKLRESEKKKFKARRNLFLQNQFHSLLNNHALLGEYKGYRSINVSGDLRVVYELVGKDVVYFITIDSHRNLY